MQDFEGFFGCNGSALFGDSWMVHWTSGMDRGSVIFGEDYDGYCFAEAAIWLMLDLSTSDLKSSSSNCIVIAMESSHMAKLPVGVWPKDN